MDKVQSLSASHRWLSCTASLLYNGEFHVNANTVKGNLIHEVSALRLEEIFHDKDNAKEIETLKENDYFDEKEPNIKAHWDAECDKISDAYIEYAIKVAKQYNPIRVEIEQRVDLNWYGFQKYGFIDLIMICEDMLIIIDLKTGRTKVETKDNSQMLMYTVAKIQQEMKLYNKKYDKYIISICQPIISNIDAYQYSFNSVFDWFASFKDIMEEIKKDDLHYRPSPFACKYCDHRKTCIERLKKGVV